MPLHRWLNSEYGTHMPRQMFRFAKRFCHVRSRAACSYWKPNFIFAKPFMRMLTNNKCFSVLWEAPSDASHGHAFPASIIHILQSLATVHLRHWHCFWLTRSLNHPPTRISKAARSPTSTSGLGPSANALLSAWKPHRQGLAQLRTAPKHMDCRLPVSHGHSEHRQQEPAAAVAAGYSL